MEEITIENIIKIINLYVKNIDITEKMVNDDLSLLGMDSIAFIQIIVALEEKFNCDIPDNKLLVAEMNTISKIINVLKSSLN